MGVAIRAEIKEGANILVKLYKLITKQVYIYHERCVRINLEYEMNTLKYVFAPYIVLADWDETKWHYAWTRREALEWMDCYPKTQVAMVKRRLLQSRITRDDIITVRF